MFKVIALVLVAFASPTFVAHAEDVAPTSSATAADHMVDSIKAEGNAMEACAGAIKADVKAGKVKLMAGAEGRWDAGSAMWAEVRELAANGNEKAAFDKMRDLRHLFGDTLLKGFKGKASKSTLDAFKAYWQIADKRISHIVEYGKSHELSEDVKGHYTAGVDHWEKAKAAQAKKDFRGAFTEMLQGLSELDEVMWSVHKGE
jgi:hypothetical protein